MAHIGHMQPTNNAVRRDASPLECSGDFRHGLLSPIVPLEELSNVVDRLLT